MHQSTRMDGTEMSEQNQEQRGCRECGEPDLHFEDCYFVDARGFSNRRLKVLDSERSQPTDPDQINPARSNHFTNEAIDHGGFPAHISTDGKAYYSERSPAPEAPAVAETCKWTEDPSGSFTSACNNGWWFEDGDTQDHGWVHCPYCGKEISHE